MLSMLRKVYIRLRILSAQKTFGAGCSLGNDVRFGPFARFQHSGTKVPSLNVGSHVYLDCTLTTSAAGTITIGDNCWIGGAGSTHIGAVSRVAIGNNVIISNHVHIYDNNNHPTDPASRLRMTNGEFFGELWGWEHAANSPILISDNVWIGESSMILKGVTIGAGSIVAAHSVVTSDVPANTIVAGNPARVVKFL